MRRRTWSMWLVAIVLCPWSLAAWADSANCELDRNGDGIVEVRELVSAASAAVSDCSGSECAGDIDGDGTVTIEELVAAVAVAPEGCELAVPTPSATSLASASPTPSPTVAAECPAVNFLDVTRAAGPGGSYSSLAPSLSVTCSESTVTVASNGIATYQYIAETPNGLQAKNYSFRFPRNPVVAAAVTQIPLLSQVAVAVNGVPIFGVNEGPQPVSDAYGDPIAAGILDPCGSHSAQQGTFHYHELLVKCLVQSAVASSQPWNDEEPAADVASPIIGYAFDGFPIYGPLECSDAECASLQSVLSGWDQINYQSGSVGCTSNAACSSGYCAAVMIAGERTTACVPKTCAWSNHAWSSKGGSSYLDPCNGHFGPRGDYHYHATDTFPYTLGCYRGTPTNNGAMGTPPGGTCAAVPTPSF